MKFVKKILSIILILCILCSFAGHFNSHAANLSTYQFSYLSEKEAFAFLGFLFGTNSINEKLKDTDIFRYMTGGLHGNPAQEQDAMIAFSSMASQLLNARISDEHNEVNVASANIITFLENRYGVNAEYELANSLINQEIDSIKDIILDFVAIATETDIEEIKHVCKIFDLIHTVIHYKEKIKEYEENIQAVFDTVRFATSVERADMYDQFKLYIYYADCHLSFGESELADMIVDISQSAYSMVHEATAWVDAVKAADFLHILSNYWVNWNTEQRISLLKKWAMFVAYSAKAPEAPVPVDTEYNLSNGVLLSDGTIVNGKSRTYHIKYPLTVQMDPEDLQYEQVEGGIKIKKYIGVAGKYHYIALPSHIQNQPVVEIEKNAFREINLDGVIIPNTIKLIDDYAFYGIPELKRIVILNNNVKIGEGAFDWSMGSANQTIGNTPIYCNYLSNAYQFCAQHEGFIFKSLAWDGKDIWGVATNNKEFHIYTAAELAYIAYLTNLGADFKSFKIVLENDINIGSKEFTPIGLSKDTCYKGSFDGQNHNILSLNIKSVNGYNALFGYVQAKNNTFKDVSISGKLNDEGEHAGAFIAYLENDCNRVHLSNITSNISASGTYAYAKGGILGTISGNGNSVTALENCTNIGRVYSFAAYGGNTTGGIVGRAKLKATDLLKIYRCSNTGTLFGECRYQSADCAVGGMLGNGENGQYEISECAVGGDINAISGGYFLGGLIGKLVPNNFHIKDCMVSSPLVGKQIGVGRPYIAQIVGVLGYKNATQKNVGHIENSYASCAMYEAQAIWGASVAVFINSNEVQSEIAVTLNNVYSDSSKNDATVLVGGQGYLGGLQPAPSENWNNAKIYSSFFLKNWKSLYSQWDMDTIWNYVQGGYPVLRAYPEIKPCDTHIYSAQTTPATCTKEGYTVYTCQNCKKRYTGDYVEKLGHDYFCSKKAVADCENKGYEVYTCSRCDDSYTSNETEPLGHTYTLFSQKASTCNTAGSETYICSRCQASEVRTLPKLDGIALTSALQKASEKLHKNYFTSQSLEQLNTIYLAHQQDANTLTDQAAVDESSAQLEAAIAALELLDTAQGSQNGIHWEWSRQSGVLRIYGNRAMEDYAKEYAPWADVLVETQTIKIENGIRSVGSYAFYGAKNATQISLPQTIDTIGAYAFYECSSIQKLIIPDSVNEIGNRSFCNCTALKHIQVPASAIYYTYAFFGDESIEDIYITAGRDNQMPDIANTLVIPFFNMSGVFGPWKYAKNAVVYVEESVNNIGKNCFYGCSGVNKIIFSNSECAIYDSENTFAPNTVLCAQFDSTAKIYAQQYDRVFTDIDDNASYHNINSTYTINIPAKTPAKLFLINHDLIYCFDTTDGMYTLTGNIKEGTYDVYVKPLYGFSILIQKQIDSKELRESQIQKSVEPQMGDFNLDGIIDIADVSELLSAYQNKNLNDEETLVYDINGDGIIDIMDLSYILQDSIYTSKESNLKNILMYSN